MDSDDSQAAEARHGVRGTPTFVWLNGNSEVIDHVDGWPGEGHLTAAIEDEPRAN